VCFPHCLVITSSLVYPGPFGYPLNVNEWIRFIHLVICVLCLWFCRTEFIYDFEETHHMAGILKLVQWTLLCFMADKLLLSSFKDTCKASGPDPGSSSSSPDIWLLG